MIEWTQVIGFKGLYEINRQGQIRSCHKRNLNKIIASRVDRGGYIATSLSKQGKAKTYLLHRLIAKTYIPNPDDKRFINHINGNKQDNRIENLEWVTHSENMKHAYSIGLINKTSKSIIDNCNGKIYSGVKEAATDMGINNSTLRGYLSGAIRRNPTCLEYIKAA